MYESVDFRTWESVEAKAAEARQARQDPLLQVQTKERHAVSVSPARTRERTLLLATLVAVFFLVSRWADEEKVVSIVRSVTVVAFLVSMFGLVQLLTWNGKIYWVRRVPSLSGTGPSAFGPFVNHDHFAGYVEMAIPTALSFAFWLMARRRSRSRWGPTATSRVKPPFACERSSGIASSVSCRTTSGWAAGWGPSRTALRPTPRPARRIAGTGRTTITCSFFGRPASRAGCCFCRAL